MPRWYLETFVGESKKLLCVRIDISPFWVGRGSDLPLCIDSPDVSRLHAEFTLQGNALVLRDLGSTNGTFVNHNPIAADYHLKYGDIIHFANIEYRLISEDTISTDCEDNTRIGMNSKLSSRLPGGLREFGELLDKGMVTGVMQPILRGDDGSVHGYELFGRGIHPDLPSSPMALFRIAESAGFEVRLSELFRRRCLRTAVKRGVNAPLFVNIHPREMDDMERLIASFRRVRQKYPALPMVLEVHEESVTDLASMNWLKECLLSQRIQIAYDDFGRGQARLLELVEAPPDYLKFDISLIRGLNEEKTPRRQMLDILLGLSRQSGIVTLAEGVQSAEEATGCRSLGFDLLQGYYFQVPA